MNNYTAVKIELNRIEVCDLLLACLAARELSNDGGAKWNRLRGKIKEQLEVLDRQSEE